MVSAHDLGVEGSMVSSNSVLCFHLLVRDFWCSCLEPNFVYLCLNQCGCACVYISRLSTAMPA